MAFSVLFGVSDKRLNSTKQPTLSISINVNLKSGTSVESPTFELQGQIDWKWNYCYCQTFGKYYFISNISYEKSMYYISCTCDYLASYKDEILANSPYVTRSAKYFNSNLSDCLFPCVSGANIVQAVSGSFGFSNDGSIILTTAGKSGNAFHAMSPAQFSELCNYLYSSTFIDALTDWTKIGDVITKQVFNTDDYIISACWVPVSIGGGSDDISLGPISGCGTGTSLSQGRIWGKVVSLEVPHHSQYDADFEYRDVEPFSSYKLMIPYIGTIPIDGRFIKKNRSLSIGMGMDINGNIDCTVFSPAGTYGHFFGSSGANVGFSSRSSNGGGEIVKGGAATIASGVTGNFIGAATGILSVVGGLIGNDITSSGSGGCVAQDDFCTITCTFSPQTTVDIKNYGRPLCQPTLLSTLSGYTQTENAHITCSASDRGKAEIENILNGGVYIE